jgi:hypothetical protein
MFDFKQIAKGAEAMGEVGTRIVTLLESIDSHLLAIENLIADASMLLNSNAAMQYRGALNEYSNTPFRAGNIDGPPASPVEPE